MTCRNDEKGQQLYKELCEKYPEDVERFFYQQLDITDENSIANLLDFIKKNFKKFDYLVNNAGYSSTGRDFNEEICEETFKVNYTGTVNFTEKMFGTINKNGKIIFVTAKSGTATKLKNENLIGKFKNAKNVDDIAKLGERFKKSVQEDKTEADGWYKNCFAISKLLLNYYAKLVTKKREISRESISVFSMHPGWCKTDMGGPHAPLEPTEGAERIIYLLELPDISKYDTVYLGTPVWWYTFASPIRTFLEENNFEGKTIMPFCTHGGGGASSTYIDIKQLVSNANVKEGYTSYNNSARLSEIENWIK